MSAYQADRNSQPDDDAAALRDLMRSVRRLGSLGPVEHKRLVDLAARGDRSSLDRLVAAHLGMVIRLATARADQGLSIPDLVQEGSIGLVEAIRSYPSSGESGFANFAEARVVAQMEVAIAAESAAVREGELLVTAATDYERVELLMRQTLRRQPTVAELAEKLEWTVERARYVADVVATARLRHDEEILEFVDPDAIDFDDDDELAELDG